jgi:hypothetical protein
MSIEEVHKWVTTLEDVCLGLLIVRKHVYNCNHFVKEADHIQYMWQYVRERVFDEKERKESTR